MMGAVFLDFRSAEMRSHKIYIERAVVGCELQLLCIYIENEKYKPLVAYA